ncbi:Two-component system response regulator [Tenacibaculum sp. 190130A14a]|uniref:Two-component system, LytTR family, response regulator n=1 Tax=Tenacibaculum polynesiense TaxID=3137857 RepID=A0ABM9P9N1_9FLAO
MKCVILEDELPAQLVLKNYIAKFNQLELVATFQTAIEANSYLKEHSVDLLFLDINLPDISGLEFVKSVKNPPKIIMTTAYPNFAVDSFELDTIVDYLVKPFSLNRFLKAIGKAEKLHQVVNSKPSESFVYLNIDKTLHKVDTSSILYIESDRNYLTFVTTAKKYLIIDSLKNWKEKLEPYHFIQVHKSFLVNLKKINNIAGNLVQINEKKIPVGRTYKKKLMANF